MARGCREFHDLGLLQQLPKCLARLCSGEVLFVIIGRHGQDRDQGHAPFQRRGGKQPVRAFRQRRDGLERYAGEFRGQVIEQFHDPGTEHGEIDFYQVAMTGDAHHERYWTLRLLLQTSFSICRTISAAADPAAAPGP